MKMKKRRLRKRVVVAVVTVVILCVCTYCLLRAFGVSLAYIERNPQRMITRLEKTFEVDFPDDIKDARAAETWLTWDNWAHYAIKFRADPAALRGFLGGIMDLDPYEQEEDQRPRFCFRPPKWLLEPILNGKMRYLTLDAKRRHASYGVNVYVDTSNEGGVVVYMLGTYHGPLPK